MWSIHHEFTIFLNREREVFNRERKVFFISMMGGYLSSFVVSMIYDGVYIIRRLKIGMAEYLWKIGESI